MEKRRNSGIIYDSTREHLMNQLFQIQRLQDEGKSLHSLEQVTFNKIVHLAEIEDGQKLDNLREELKNL